MARSIDLDLLEEEVEIKWKGSKKWLFREPTIKQHLKHSKLVNDLNKIGDEIRNLPDDAPAEKADALMQKYTEANTAFDREMFKIFFPDMTDDEYLNMTLRQKQELLKLVFPPVEEKKTDTGTKKKDAEPPGEQS